MEEAEEIRHEPCLLQITARNIIKNEQKTLQDNQAKENLIVVRADKGNATTVMAREDYNQNLHTFLKQDYYNTLKRNATNKIERQINKLSETNYKSRLQTPTSFGEFTTTTIWIVKDPPSRKPSNTDRECL